MSEQCPPRRAAPPLTGRPTREGARQRHEDLLDGALEMFLAKGYEMTTIEGISASTGITKRTIYRRYKDKKALFLATVERFVNQWSIPISAFQAAEVDDLEQTLLATARLRNASILTSAGLRLQRLVYAESYRFPEISQYYDAAISPAIDFLVDLFRRHHLRGTITAGDPEAAALAFLSVASTPTHAAILGQPIDPDAIDEQVKRRLQLLLYGLSRPQT